MLHTWRSPIVCRGCGARLHFNRRQWYTAAGWFGAALVFIVLTVVFGGRFIEIRILRPVVGVMFALTLVRWLWFACAELELTVADES